MTYRVAIMCKSKHTPEQELGDIGENFVTEEEAETAAENSQITQEDYEAAAEAIGLKVWLKAVENKT